MILRNDLPVVNIAGTVNFSYVWFCRIAICLNASKSHFLSSSLEITNAATVITERQGLVTKKQCGDSCTEQENIFFLKVHKAAGTTVMNVIFRFAYRRQLNVMLPRTSNALSQAKKIWRHKSIVLPPGKSRFNVLCNHVVFNEDEVKESLYPNAVYVGIIREPLELTVSSFNYYRYVFHVKYLTKIPGKYPLKTYFKSPMKWEPASFSRSFTHNRISFDFGMDDTGLRGNNKSIEEYIAYINRTFDLIMICERFDESMVLLKRLMNWDLTDVIYLRNNVFPKKLKPRRQQQLRLLSENEKQTHRLLNLADYRMYDYFSKEFQTKVNSAGTTFRFEVAAFKYLQHKVNEYCNEKPKHFMYINETAFSESIELTPSDCQLMSLKTINFVNMLRSKQLKRYRLDNAKAFANS